MYTYRERVNTYRERTVAVVTVAWLVQGAGGDASGESAGDTVLVTIVQGVSDYIYIYIYMACSAPLQ